MQECVQQDVVKLFGLLLRTEGMAESMVSYLRAEEAFVRTLQHLGGLQHLCGCQH